MPNYTPPDPHTIDLEITGAYTPPSARAVPISFGLSEAPDPFSFAPLTGVEPNTVYVSDAITLTGFDVSLPISVTGGAYSINGGPFLTAPQSVNSGSQVRLRATSSSGFSTTVQAVLTVGGVAGAWQITTRAADVTPDAFSFNPVNGAQPNTIYCSNSLVVTGLEPGYDVPISIAAGEYALNGGAWTSAAGVIHSGDSVQVRQMSSSNYSTTTTATLTIGTYSAQFAVTTYSPDTTPDNFSFGSISGVLPNSVQTSGAITVSGVDIAVPISIDVGQYSINGGAWTSATGQVQNGDQVRVRLTASGQFSTTVTATVTIGAPGVTGTFSVTTAARDTTPDPFAFTPVDDAVRGQLYISNAITVSGINDATPISIDTGAYRINGGAWTGSAGTVVAGDLVEVELMAPGDYHQTATATLTIGGVSAEFRVSTGYAPPFRGPSSSYRGLWGGGLELFPTWSVTSTQGPPKPRALTLAADQGAPIRPQVEPAWSTGKPSPRTVAIDGSTSRGVTPAQLSVVWDSVPPKRSALRLPWAPFDPARRAWSSPWSNPLVKRPQTRVAWDKGRETVREIRLPVPNPRALNRYDTIPWRQLYPARWKHTIEPPYVPPPPQDQRCYVPPLGVGLVLGFGALGNYPQPSPHAVPINFKCRADRLFWIGRSLIVQNVITAVRDSDNLPLKLAGCSLSIDSSSWAWNVSLAFADRASLLAVAPDPNTGPQTVRVTLNGHVWRALVEQYTSSRQFPGSKHQASGRSRAALLDAPYSAPRPYISDSAMNAQQLAVRELGFSGFAIDWQAPDWLVPAGAFAYDNETPLGAILKIAASIGATVQADASADVIHIASRYSIWPWHWYDPGTEVAETIDANAVVSIGATWKPGAGYKGIFVSGTNAGIVARVILDGSDGTPYAPMVSDQLITDTTPARERGGVEIANAQNQQEFQLVLPLLPDPQPPGLLAVGSLIEVQDAVWGTYRALVTGVTIDASLQNGAWTLRQTATVRRFV